MWGPPLVAYVEVSESVTAEASGDRTDHSGSLGALGPLNRLRA